MTWTIRRARRSTKRSTSSASSRRAASAFSACTSGAQGADALNEVLVVEDGDTVIIPRGYHPVVAAPGYQLSYVWALRGEGRRYGAWSDDPAHAWLRNVEPLLNAR